MQSAAPQTSLEESKRVKKLRLYLTKCIPKFPNNKETMELLQAMPLGTLFLTYITWASRLIPPKPRLVAIEPTLTSDIRWKALTPDAKALFAKVSRGENLNPHLSLKVLRNGFTPRTSKTTPGTDKWEDKDFVLTVMGYHHLHLSQLVEGAGHVKRTDQVLFAQITKEKFIAIGFFDHSVFDAVDGASGHINNERQRLWEIFDKRNTLGMQPGTVYMTNPIATSGHSLRHVRLASSFSRVIHQFDNKLDSALERKKCIPTSARGRGACDEAILEIQLS